MELALVGGSEGPTPESRLLKMLRGAEPLETISIEAWFVLGGVGGGSGSAMGRTLEDGLGSASVNIALI